MSEACELFATRHEINEMFRMGIEKRVGFFTFLGDSIEPASCQTGMLRGVLETLCCHECDKLLVFGWRNVGRIVRGPGTANVSNRASEVPS